MSEKLKLLVKYVKFGFIVLIIGVLDGIGWVCVEEFVCCGFDLVFVVRWEVVLFWLVD